jgi:hypothetical protein
VTRKGRLRRPAARPKAGRGPWGGPALPTLIMGRPPWAAAPFELLWRCRLAQCGLPYGGPAMFLIFQISPPRVTT